jgi:Fe-S-cluster containining protein
MANAFEKELGIPLPQCCNHGDCCKGASPSTPYHQLMARAAQGDEFARGFFSIMVPYKDHAEAAAVVPGVVKRTLEASRKLTDFKGPEDIVFYRCRYQTPDNKCGVWEDRPQFCRDYPDTPFVVMAPGCAFEPWAASCKEKYHAMKAEVAKLKEMKAELERLKQIQGAIDDSAQVVTDEQNSAVTASTADGQTSVESANLIETGRIDAPYSGLHNVDNLSLVLSLTRLYVSSPFCSVYL